MVAEAASRPFVAGFAAEKDLNGVCALNVVAAQNTNAVVLATGVFQRPVSEKKTLRSKVGALDEAVIVDVPDVLLVLPEEERGAVGKPGFSQRAGAGCCGFFLKSGIIDFDTPGLFKSVGALSELLRKTEFCCSVICCLGILPFN